MLRRDFLIGTACLGATAAAEMLRPRDRIVLIGSSKLEDITPRSFGQWREIHVGQVIQPRTEGTLAAELYSQLLGRVYQHSNGDYMMLAVAYGDTQSDVLQLHRPETCYPAFGLTISRSSLADVNVGSVVVPTRNLVASVADRLENITYWTRIGEYLPTDGAQQREDKLRTAFAGIIPDGILVRASSLGEDAQRSMARNAEFLREMVLAIDPVHLPVFIGRQLAKGIPRTR